MSGGAPVTLRIELAYDGTGFCGWAAQPGKRAVESELVAALARLIGGERPALTVAGRTDAGVHAWRQVVSLRWSGPPADTLVRALNGLLPHDIAVHAVTEMPDGFDARRDARSRTYCYRLLAGPVRWPLEHNRALWRSRPLDTGLLDACAEMLVGEHDFTAFTPTETDHVRFARRILAARWERERPHPVTDSGTDPTHILGFWIEGDTFMRHMVRAIVGTMLEVACDRRDIDTLPELLSGAHRRDAGETAPAHGLHLVRVTY
ncbi:MAG: tRNA pseudouridine(38-40) synthase TruA [Solirubrobacterales bacterium]